MTVNRPLRAGKTKEPEADMGCAPPTGFGAIFSLTALRNQV
jgi:hypothetical protein